MQHWGDGHNVVTPQEDLMQTALALVCFSFPPEFVDLLLDHHNLLLLLACKATKQSSTEEAMQLLLCVYTQGQLIEVRLSQKHLSEGHYLLL